MVTEINLQLGLMRKINLFKNITMQMVFKDLLLRDQR